MKIGSLSRIVRFGIVGLTTTCIYFAVLIALRISVDQTIALTAIAYVAAAIANYVLQSRFAFGKKLGDLKYAPRYFAMHSICLCANSSLMWLGHDIGGLPFVHWQIMVTGLVAVLSFFISSRWVYVD